MLTSFPILMASKEVPFPDSWQENPQRVSNSFEMENGGRKKIGIRTKLMSISASFTVTSRWLEYFQYLRDQSSFVVSIYDAQVGGYQNYVMEITDDSFSYDLIKNSKRVKNTDGLWRVSFDLEEF